MVKGDKHDPKNYRPISLTSVLSKVCESLVRDSIIEHLQVTEQLCKEQHGFLPRRSCIGQLLTCLEDWTKQLDQGHPVDVIYCDFQRAFDSVPHQRLLRKVYCFGIRGQVLAWLEAFLTGRRQRVVVNGVKSGWAPVMSGIPQGTVLGPTLFLLYVADLPSNLQNNVQMFADDTKLYGRSGSVEECKTLQADLQVLEVWSKEWMLPFNTSKCKSLHLGRSNLKQRYAVNGIALQQVSEERDLGVTIDEVLKFRTQAAEAVKKANRVLGAIRRSFVNIDSWTLPILFKALVRPLLEYGNAIWGPHNKEDQLMVERVQRRATKLVRHIRDLPYAERLKILNLPSLQYRRKRGDVILCYQVMHGKLDLSSKSFFYRAPPAQPQEVTHLKLRSPMHSQG